MKTAANRTVGISAERIEWTVSWNMGRLFKGGDGGGSEPTARLPPPAICVNDAVSSKTPKECDFFANRLRLADDREKLPAVDLPPLTLEQLTQEIRDVALQVHAAQERLEDRDFISAAHAAVDSMNRRFKDLLASLASSEQMVAERALGRRVADVRRMASLLPRIPAGQVISTPDRQVSGTSLIGERRITGVSWSNNRTAPADGLRVGGEVDAWCGKCGETKTHNIIAMVGSDPKQVLCQSCGSRHTYRTGPARKRAAEGIAESASSRPQAPDREAARKAEIMRALGEEVSSAETVRVFNPKERYKAGEIISHPQYGRGKIENVLRSSLLVRFPRSGLKPLSLV
jgi:hypothetical protein